MKAPELLLHLDQSIWLDDITRNLVDSGTLKHYIDELSVTGLPSDPRIFNHAINNSSDYHSAIREKLSRTKSGERYFSSWPRRTLRELLRYFDRCASERIS
jgi:transaldolase